MLCHAENKLKIFTCNLDVTEIFELCNVSTKDWIITAKWMDGDNIVTLTMHNILIVYNSCLEEKCRYICEENCLLYSGFICHDFLGELIVFSGTVFSEVLVWRPTENGICSVLHRLTGHKVITITQGVNL